MVNELEKGYDFVFANVDIEIKKKDQNIEMKENVLEICIDSTGFENIF